MFHAPLMSAKIARDTNRQCVVVVAEEDEGYLGPAYQYLDTVPTQCSPWENGVGR